MVDILKFEDLLDKNMGLKDEVAERLIYNILASAGMQVSANRLTLMVERARQKIIGASLVVLAVNMMASVTFDPKRGDLLFGRRTPEEALLLLEGLAAEDQPEEKPNE